MRGWLVLVVALTACGRIGFDGFTGGDTLTDGLDANDGTDGPDGPDANDGAIKPSSTAQVQSGTTTLTGVTVDVTIAAVDPSKAFLMFGASNDGATPDGDADGFQLCGQLIGPTTLRFERAVNPGSPATITWYVVELSTGMSVQRGRGNLRNLTSLDAPLSPVDPAHAFPIISFRTLGGTYDGGDYLRARIESPTSLAIVRSEAEDQISNVEWQVVQLDAASVQSGLYNLAATALSGNVSINAIDPARTLLLFTYSRGLTSTGLMGLRGRVVDATTLTFDRDAADNDALSIAWYAIELPVGASVQRIPASFGPAQTTASLDIDAVDRTRALALGGGVYYRGGKSPSLEDVRGLNTFTFELTSSTTLQLRRFVAGDQVDLEAQVIELP